jgi:hypothetical protein
MPGVQAALALALTLALTLGLRLFVALSETDGLRVGDVAFPLMLTAPKLILASVVSLRESKMRAHIVGCPAAASGSLAVMR